MYKVRYKTEEEKEKYSFQGFAGEPESIVIEEELDPKRKGFVLAHEIGHVRFPVQRKRLSVAERRKLSDKDYIRYCAETDVTGLLDELYADYFVLKESDSVYNKREARKHIRWIKSTFTRSLSPIQIKRLDAVARRLVDYEGPEIK